MPSSINYLIWFAFFMVYGYTEAGPTHSSQPHNLFVKEVGTAACLSDDCLIIAENAVYCSIDPYALQDGAIFSSKSRLAVKSGVYALSGKRSLSDLTIHVQTRHGTTELRPASEEMFSIRRSDLDEESGVAPVERLEIKAPYASDRLLLNRFFLRTPRGQYDQFQLGDPEDVRGFFKAGRNLLLRMEGRSPLFPGLINQTILFAPCAMRDLTDEAFVFEFSDGSSLELVVRAISGSYEIGYYVGRLLSAKGNFAGMNLSISDHDHLAFIGSTRSWAEMAIPTLVVQFAEGGDTCGLILDSSQWETVRAVNGYVAYKMTCDDNIGEAVNLKSVTYPKQFSLP